jgi:hypothetical protein
VPRRRRDRRIVQDAESEAAVLPNSSDGFKQLAMDKPAVMEFMKNEVKPKMARCSAARMDPETKTGFGCGECHTTAQ